MIRHEVSQATVVAAAMATEEPLLGDTETGQSPALPQKATQTYGALDDNAKEEQRKKDQRRELNERDIKRMDKELDVYINMAGAELRAENKGQGPDDESNQKKMDGSDGAIGGAQETKEDPEEDPEEAASPKP